MSPGRAFLLILAAGCVALALWGVGALSDYAALEKLLVARIGLLVLAAGFLLAAAFYRRVVDGLARLYTFVESNEKLLPVAKKETASAFETVFDIVFIVSALAAVVYCFLDQKAFVFLAREDGPIENATALFYLGATVATLYLLARARHLMLLRLYLAGFAGLFFFVGMEELSWGQRLFGFGTPALIRDLNVQDEFTLHNIWSISLFTYPALAFTTTVLFIVPILHRLSSRAGRLLDLLQFPAPPLRYAGLYALACAAYVAIGVRLGTPSPLPISWGGVAPNIDDEYLEFAIAFLFFILAITGWRVIPTPPNPLR